MNKRKNEVNTHYKIIGDGKSYISSSVLGVSVLTAPRDGWYEITNGKITIRKKLKKGQSVNLNKLIEENENENENE